MAQRLIDVNGRHIEQARGRTGNTAELSYSLHETESKETHKDSIQKRFTSLFTRGWERVTVNGEVDSITMPKWIASALLGTMLLFLVQSWWARSSDHDTMIRIETKLEEAQKAAEKIESRQSGTNADFEAWRGTMNGKLSEIKGMLSQQQLDAVEQIKRNGTNH